MPNINEEILAILEEIQPGADFAKGTNFVENGYLDSFDVITLVSELEDRFNIIISALEILPENFDSLDSIAELVAKSEKRN